jgi:carbon storage regulator CsrA
MGWLVLSARDRESVLIGESITVKVIKARHGVVKLALEAPREVGINRRPAEGPPRRGPRPRPDGGGG